MAIEINENNFGEMVLRSSLPVVLEFYSNFCKYCVVFKPTFAELAKEYEGKVRFATINYDSNKDLALKLNMQEGLVPAFYLIKDGDVLDRWYGTKDGKNTVKKLINDRLSIY